MFWETFITILLFLWVIRYVGGSAYGVYLMYKTHPSTWRWETQLIVGLPFWIGYYTVVSIKGVLRWRCRKKELGR